MTCTQAPKGWFCLIPGPHPTCAAWPTRWTRFKYWLRGDRIIMMERIPKPHKRNCCGVVEKPRTVQPPVKIPSTVVPRKKRK